MKVELSGKEERGRNMYELFPGRPIDTMPVLIEQGYEPGSVATIIDRRINAPEEVRNNWRKEFFWTGDSASTDNTGDVVLTLDAQPLRTINSKSELYQWALKLDRDGLEALKADDNSITLTPEEVQEAYGRGLTKQNGLWLPANSFVGKALGHWLRGKSFEDKDIQEYAQHVSEASRSGEVLRQYFDRSRPSQPNLRSVVVDRADSYSDVGGDDDLDDGDARLAGVAPEAQRGELSQVVARENLGNVQVPSRREIVDGLYQHFQETPLTKGITKKGLHEVLKKYF